MEREQLLFMSNDQVKESFMDKRVHVILNDGREEEFVVDKLQLTIYTNDNSHSAVGFICKLGKSHLFTSIKEIIVTNDMT